jgi:hypothetical protein
MPQTRSQQELAKNQKVTVEPKSGILLKIPPLSAAVSSSRPAQSLSSGPVSGSQPPIPTPRLVSTVAPVASIQESAEIDVEPPAVIPIAAPVPQNIPPPVIVVAPVASMLGSFQVNLNPVHSPAVPITAPVPAPVAPAPAALILPPAVPAVAALPTTGKAHWSPSEELRFIHFLWDHFPEAGNGGNFKDVTFNAAAVHMEQVRTKGGPKTAAACKGKYTSVCSTFFKLCLILIWVIQLRKIFRVVEDIRMQSGWTWDDDHGANIDAVNQGIWDAYIPLHPGALPFRNKGWPLWDYMSRMMPTQLLRGANVYNPMQIVDSQASGVNDSQASDESDDIKPVDTSFSQDWDFSQLDRDFGRSSSPRDDTEDEVVVVKQVCNLKLFTVNNHASYRKQRPQPNQSRAASVSQPFLLMKSARDSASQVLQQALGQRLSQKLASRSRALLMWLQRHLLHLSLMLVL